ncbi:thiamine biosynthesis protein ThiF [Umezawaea tangerina]|uniref:ThiF family protein n=1 Tax=Umezawaea tangerina TaxID=84725 RepID=A0A2T0S6W2_9PSEU|nr:thiamine biosynthesis protein ThiF [Umezawaea tangerina]PRY29152.1 ThiF family protein [Umezawaea tangerina]
MDTDTQDQVDLSRRPRVLPGLPVLLRRAGEVQIGTDPRHAVVVDDLPPPFVDELLALDGRHTVAELGERLAAKDADPAEFLHLLDQLAEVGLVDDAVPVPGRLTADTTSRALRTGRSGTGIVAARDKLAVVVHGNGRIAVATASLLAAAGVGRVHLVAAGRVGPEDTGSGYLDVDVGRPRREAAVDAIGRASGDVRTGWLTSTGAPDLVVLADSLVPPPALLNTLMLEGTQHLVVRAREGIGVVGPLVVPGRTSCVRCAHLHRSDQDGAWAACATQLADRTQPTDLATAAACAALAVGQVLSALDPAEVGLSPPTTWNATLEVQPQLGVLERRPSDPHVSCGCGSAGHPAAAV